MPYKKTIYIQGMTCVSCESIIADELHDVKEVESAIVCHKTKKAEIQLTSHIDESRLHAIIQKLGYQTSDEENLVEVRTSLKQWFLAFILLLALVFGYTILRRSGLMGWVEINPDSTGYGTSFLVGIVASLSTCLAVIGAVVMSFGAKYKGGGNGNLKSVRPHILFHCGRIMSFFILGGMLGIFGNFITPSPAFLGVFTIGIAIVLACLGLNILGIMPSLTMMGMHMPKKVMHVWMRLKNSEHRGAPFFIGAFTFFLPCGFTQSMQLLAISSGNFFGGALLLSFFALGTMPVLLGIGIASSKSQDKNYSIAKKVIGFIVLIFAWHTLLSGWTLASTLVIAEVVEPPSVGQMSLAPQVIEMTVDYRGYTPNIFTLKKGIPVQWNINATQISGCTNEIIVPKLGLSQKLKQGLNTIHFTPNTTGKVGFSCWMGMVRGTFIIE